MPMKKYRAMAGAKPRQFPFDRFVAAHRRRSLQDRDSPGRNLGTAAQTRASSMITHVSGFASTVARSSAPQTPGTICPEPIACASALDEGHQSDQGREVIRVSKALIPESLLFHQWIPEHT
jgi:hypothetical protein